MVRKLGTAQVAEAVAGLNGWTLSDDDRAIVRSFAFGDFVEAFGFMTRCRDPRRTAGPPSRMVQRLRPRGSPAGDP